MSSNEYNLERSNPSPEKEAWERLYRVVRELNAAGATMEYNSGFLYDELERIIARLEVFMLAPNHAESAADDGHDEHRFVPANHQQEALLVTEQHDDLENLNVLEWRVIISDEKSYVFWECSLESSDDGVTIVITQHELPQGLVTGQLAERFLAFKPNHDSDPTVQQSTYMRAFMIGGQPGAGFTDQRGGYAEDYKDISLEEMKLLLKQPL